MHVAILDGLSADSGLGMVLHAQHVIATENTKIVFRETQIGMFPQVGLIKSLANLKNGGPALGLYLTMTGRILDGKEAVMFGVATNYLKSKRLVDLHENFETLALRHTQDEMLSTIVTFLE